MKSPGGKRWGGRGRWRRRHFVLGAKSLAYMKDESSQVPKGMLDLSEMTIITDTYTIGRTSTPHAILLRTRDRAVRICAQSHRDILDWYTAIVNNVARLRSAAPGMVSTPPPNRTPRDVLEAMRKADARERERRRKEEEAMPKPKDFFPLYQPPEDYYSMIGVPPDASRSKIKRAYYKLAKDFHPDRNPDADPHHFAELSKAYAVIFNEQSRTEYDLSQSIKQVLRMGFDCVRYVPQIRVDRESGKKICTGISEESITLFADGSIEKIFYQDAEAETIDGEDDPLAAPPLRPDNENMTESRFIQQVVYGCDDQVLKAFFGDEEPDEEGGEKRIDCMLAIKGKRMACGNLYIELDNVESAEKFIEGLRIIRCEASVLFQQKLAANKEAGKR